jgi:hypothetical protein
MTEENATTASAQSRLGWAKEFQETTFWRNVMKPHLARKQKELLTNLVDCEIKDVKKIRGLIIAFYEIERFPEDFSASVNAEIEQEKLQNTEINELSRRYPHRRVGGS